ncbi:MAG: hypothetical protein H0U50_02265 [Pyrinomonadaceae bacterium]|nr:hypothetical protein [Pyrinomonadaceae bacterium]
MDARNTQTATRQSNLDEIASYQQDSEIVRQRLDCLLAVNAETARQKAMFQSDKEKLEADLMKSPLNTEKTYAYFGLLLGTFPPAAFFTKFAIDSRIALGEEAWIFGILFIVNLISAVVGYFSGKLIAKSVREVEKYSWWAMFLVLPFVGMFWGMMAGGAGGAIIFIFGAFFGAILGALVGGIALPTFTVFHRLLKRGDVIELQHFLPLAFGITFAICSFIIGS